MSAHLNDVLWSSDEEDVQVSPKAPNEQHRRQLDLFASDSEEEREETECGKEEEEGKQGVGEILSQMMMEMTSLKEAAHSMSASAALTFHERHPHSSWIEGAVRQLREGFLQLFHLSMAHPRNKLFQAQRHGGPAM